MLRKIWVGSFSMFLLAGIISMIGTVGASDLGLIDGVTLAVRLLLALLLLVMGTFGLLISEVTK